MLYYGSCKNTMAKKLEVPQFVVDNVNWCLKRCDELPHDDAAELMSEFDEWIEYLEDDAVESLSIFYLPIK
jgi:hypothetical protein